MKKILLTGAALVAFVATPAMAEGLELGLAGSFKGYGVYVDSDNDALRDFSIRKETEVHFTGETTLDSGLTVGVHVEANTDGDEGDIEESYMYLSGGWGRVNFGEEDGAMYLLQVAAPSADSNVDGLRQYISASEAGALDYDANQSGYASKLTYMTPVFNGFQAGLSYTPTVDSSTGDGNAATDTVSDEVYEVAARYEGAFEGVGVAFGAGYTEADQVGDDAEAWNAGLDLDFAGFGAGVAYVSEESTAQDIGTVGAFTADDVDTWVLGLDYQLGAYKLGASWLNKDIDAAADVDVDRYTGGVSYAYGPGMSFRGSVSYTDLEVAGAGDADETQILLGTQVNF